MRSSVVGWDGLPNRVLIDDLLTLLEANIRAQIFPIPWDSLLAAATAKTLRKDPPKAASSGKVGRRWEGQAATAQEAALLDFSKSGESEIAAKIEFGASEVDLDVNGLSSQTASSAVSAFFGKLQAKYFGDKKIEISDLSQVVDDLRDRLVSKNVAADIAAQISDSLKRALVGKRTESFTSVAQTAKDALEQSLTRLLAPNKSVDLLKWASEAKREKRVFSLLFLGVNGVGKSTSLSKIGYYFRSHGFSVLIAACDTFRAGAVEQLKTHGRNLEIPVFERGYGKDAADIAKQAVQFAQSNAFDVVLIDTAGRMQDNDPLMRSIGKLIATNNPDFVLFVGEALVGNDAIDQIAKFDRYLKESGSRGVDGIMLTKFDTVDDKVGAAISMVHATGVPVVFVGTGQKYTNLRKLDINAVVTALLAD